MAGILTKKIKIKLPSISFLTKYIAFCIVADDICFILSHHSYCLYHTSITFIYTRQKKKEKKKKKEMHTILSIHIIFSERLPVLLQFRLHHLKACLSFLEVKNVFKKIGFKPDSGQFVKSQKKWVFVTCMLSLRIELSNANRLYEPKSSKSAVLSDSNLIFDRTQLSAVVEFLLCDCPMVVGYILEINLTKRKKI